MICIASSILLYSIGFYFRNDNLFFMLFQVLGVQINCLKILPLIIQRGIWLLTRICMHRHREVPSKNLGLAASLSSAQFTVVVCTVLAIPQSVSGLSDNIRWTGGDKCWYWVLLFYSSQRLQVRPCRKTICVNPWGHLSHWHCVVICSNDYAMIAQK